MGFIEKRVGSYTYKSPKNEKNEDSIVCFENKKSETLVEYLVGVADGMGGYIGGDVASKMVTDFLEQSFRDGNHRALFSQYKMKTDHLGVLFKEVLMEVNQNLYKERMKNPESAKMGTTFTGAIGYEMEVFIGHIGDTRAYRVRGGRLEKLTRDHTIGDRLIQNGLPKNQIAPALMSSLYRSVGYLPFVKMDFHIHKAFPNDMYLFCSDGLFEVLTEQEMERILLKNEYDPVTCSKALVEAAIEKRVLDDVSVACVLYLNMMGLELSQHHSTHRLEL